jgi:hypothetical protein
VTKEQGSYALLPAPGKHLEHPKPSNRRGGPVMLLKWFISLRLVCRFVYRSADVTTKSVTSVLPTWTVLRKKVEYEEAATWKLST